MDEAASESDASPHEGNIDDRPRYSRRLSDKILIAFHQACDQADFDVAEELLLVLQTMLNRQPVVPGSNRRSIETMVAAHERLWQLRHPETGDA
jgi:hypothetical protein